MTVDATPMVRIEGGTFRMGSAEFYPDETPGARAHRRLLRDRRAPRDQRAVRRVRPGDGLCDGRRAPARPGGFPGRRPARPRAGRVVFTPTAGPVDLRDWRQWWRWGEGASWRHPFGPESSVDDKPTHPVAGELRGCHGVRRVGGRRLPTEPELEYAARGGLDGRTVRVGRRGAPGRTPHGEPMAGAVPLRQHGRRGLGRHVARHDVPAERLWALRRHRQRLGVDHRLLHATTRGARPGGRRPGLAGEPARRGIRRTGLAHPTPGAQGRLDLCSPEYCLRYRPAARSPQADDTATTHIGFRCVRDA